MKNSRINHRAHSAPTNRFRTASSTKRSLASRRNGAKSHGPISEQGKLKSSRNSLKHGYFATNPLIISTFYRENPSKFNELLDELRKIYKPQNVIEESFVYDAATVLLDRRRYHEFERGKLKQQIKDLDAPEVRQFEKMKKELNEQEQQFYLFQIQILNSQRFLLYYEPNGGKDFDEARINRSVRERYEADVTEQIELAKKGMSYLSDDLQTELNALGLFSETSFEVILRIFLKIKHQLSEELLALIARAKQDLKIQKRKVSTVVRESLVLREKDIDRQPKEDTLQKRFDKIIERLRVHQDMIRQQEEFDRQEQSRRKLPNRKR